MCLLAHLEAIFYFSPSEFTCPYNNLWLCYAKIQCSFEKSKKSNTFGGAIYFAVDGTSCFDLPVSGNLQTKY